MKRYKVRKNIWRFLRHIQFISEVSDLLHILLGCNSGLQNLIKTCIINTPYGNKTIRDHTF